MVIVRKPTKEEIQTAQKWGLWEKEPSSFDWSYDEKETCLILEGEAKVVLPNKEQIHFKSGDYVIFEPGLKCKWVISKKIRKRYLFG
ncbi:MAG: cupin domain-containing protein [Candidatus Micrarchaeia archaeon]|jgi:uncharacterized cupin superfamily protein